MTAAVVRPVAIKIDEDIKARVKRLAEARHRTAHWLMREAITQYVERDLRGGVGRVGLRLRVRVRVRVRVRNRPSPRLVRARSAPHSYSYSYSAQRYSYSYSKGAGLRNKLLTVHDSTMVLAQSAIWLAPIDLRN